MAYPEWVEKYRQKGTNISCIRGKYYLYACSSKYDPVKKRAKKITGEYLGRITEDGLIPPKRKKDRIDSVTVKEFGASNSAVELGSDIYDALKKHFPKETDRLFSLALLRLIEKCPFKRIEEAYRNSYLSELYGELSLSSASLSTFLKEFGKNRTAIVDFLKEFIALDEYVIFDGTSIVSNSAYMDINRMGYNSHRRYDPQINLMMAFSASKHMPGYYRVIPGNIRDVVAFKQSVQESGIQNMTIIADKGFGSHSNFELMDEHDLKYIVPLRRNNGLIDRTKLKSGNRSDFDGHFIFKERVIWYYSYKVDNRTIIIYLDSDLRNEEEKDYALRIQKQLEGFSDEGLLEKQYDFGTISFCTNIDESPEKIYSLYKTRGEVEQSFDFLKNLLDQDKIYLQSQYSVEAWAFLNQLSLMLVYRIYSLLHEKDLTKKYSVSDFLNYLKYIRKSKINNVWYTGEITKATQTLLDKLEIHIT